MSPESWLWLALWRLPASRLPRVEGLLCTEEAWGLFETSTPPQHADAGFLTADLHAAAFCCSYRSESHICKFLALPLAPSPTACACALAIFSGSGISPHTYPIPPDCPFMIL